MCRAKTIRFAEVSFVYLGIENGIISSSLFRWVNIVESSKNNVQ